MLKDQFLFYFKNKGVFLRSVSSSAYLTFIGYCGCWCNTPRVLHTQHGANQTNAFPASKTCNWGMIYATVLYRITNSILRDLKEMQTSI